MALTSANSAQATADFLRAIWLVDLEFPAGAIRVTDLDRDITVSGVTYSSATILQGISGIQDNIDGKPRRMSVQLSGIDDVLRARTLASRIAFGRAQFRMAFCDANWVPVDTPVTLALARLSQAEATFAEGRAVLEISVETGAILFRGNDRPLFSEQGHKQRFAGDTGLRRVNDVPGISLAWGGTSKTAGTNTTPSSGGSTVGQRIQTY